eukprot:4978915-Pleurochrysis_carterae.AAC.1
MAKQSASRRGRWQYTRRIRRTAAMEAASWMVCVRRLSCKHGSFDECDAGVFRYRAHVFDGSIDAIDREMAGASVDKIFESPIELTNLSRHTLGRVIPAGHRVHEGIRSDREGVVCGVLADADVVVIW